MLIEQNKTTVTDLEKKAKDGDADAQFRLALLLYNNLERVRLDDDVEKWLKAAADQGHTPAQFSLGIYYERLAYLFEPEQRISGLSYIENAARQGHPQAQRFMGDAFRKGWMGKQDNSQAAKWYSLAAEQGDSESLIQLGSLYDNGIGVKQDYSMAFKFYLQATQQSNADAQFLVGFCYFKGIGVHIDHNAAFNWFKQAAEQDNKEAQYWLAKCYYSNLGVMTDYAEALFWIKVHLQTIDDDNTNDLLNEIAARVDIILTEQIETRVQKWCYDHRTISKLNLETGDLNKIPYPRKS